MGIGSATLFRLRQFDRAVVVAVPVVLVVEVSVHQVVDVVAVGNGRVSAVGTVHVIGVVTAAAMTVGAGFWVGATDLDAMFVYMIAVGMMQMSVVEVVDMSVVLDGDVAAVGAVDMIVFGVLVAVAHGFLAAKPLCRSAVALRDKGTAPLLSSKFEAGARGRPSGSCALASPDSYNSNLRSGQRATRGAIWRRLELAGRVGVAAVEIAALEASVEPAHALL